MALIFGEIKATEKYFTPVKEKIEKMKGSQWKTKMKILNTSK